MAEQVPATRFATQELLACIVFFTVCGWLVVDVVLHAPQQAPALWPLIPMFAAIVWHVALDHLRTRHGS